MTLAQALGTHIQVTHISCNSSVSLFSVLADWKEDFWHGDSIPRPVYFNSVVFRSLFHRICKTILWRDAKSISARKHSITKTKPLGLVCWLREAKVKEDIPNPIPSSAQVLQRTKELAMSPVHQLPVTRSGFRRGPPYGTTVLHNSGG